MPRQDESVVFPLGPPGIPRTEAEAPNSPIGSPRYPRFCRTICHNAAILSRMQNWPVAMIVGLSWVAACGGAVGPSRSDSTNGGTHTGGAGGSAGTPAAGAALGGESTGGVTSTYVEPGCPVQPEPQVYTECDPLSATNGCGRGMGCYPVTKYPSAPCQPEVFEMLCLPAGALGQFDDCGTLTDCAPGLTCVVTGSGTMCLKMCSPTGRSNCPTGLFCDGVDLQGIGICF